jgi:hypothetical protein
VDDSEVRELVSRAEALLEQIAGDAKATEAVQALAQLLPLLRLWLSTAEPPV